MRITSLKDFRIWQLARRFADAVSELLKRPQFRRDPRLSAQLEDSSVSIVSNSAEGFGQETDCAFAHYLAIARGSNNEAISQLAVALGKGYITEGEFSAMEALSEEMGKGMTSLITYLNRQDRKHRWPVPQHADHGRKTRDQRLKTRDQRLKTND